MKMTVYIDLLILVNFVANYFLIKLASVISSSGTNNIRIITASFFGSLFSLVILLEMPLPLSIMIKIFTVVLSSVVTFGFKNKFLFVKRTAVLLVVYILFTGFLYTLFENSSYVYINNSFFYLSINPLIFVGALTVFYLIFTVMEFLFCSVPENYIYKLKVCTKYGNFTATAFYDTGFGVKDIMCLNPVIMCSMKYIEKTGLTDLYNIINNFYNGEVKAGITPLFYSDLTGSGMLAAVKTDIVMVNNKDVKNVLLAVSKKEFSKEQDIIFGKDFYDRFGD